MKTTAKITTSDKKIIRFDVELIDGEVLQSEPQGAAEGQTIKIEFGVSGLTLFGDLWRSIETLDLEEDFYKRVVFGGADLTNFLNDSGIESQEAECCGFYY